MKNSGTTSLQNYLSPQAYQLAKAEKLKRELAKRQSTTVLTQYASDIPGFVHDCFEWGNDKPTDYQDEIFERFYHERRMAVYGPHGLGKTFIASLLTLWGILTADDVKVITTASAWRQLIHYLWPEIHKWAMRLRWDVIGRQPFDSRTELKVRELTLSPIRSAFPVASDQPELVEGAHAKRILYIYDESKTIPGETFDATEGAFATSDIDEEHEAFALTISTPGDPAGRFYDICTHKPGYEDWSVRRVTLEEAIKAGRISKKWARQRKRQWGEESPVYQARVVGVFPDKSEDQLIAMSWVEAARENEIEITDKFKEEHPNEVQGVDIARFGDDDSARFGRQGPIVLDGEVWHGNDTMQSAGRVVAGKRDALVDSIGVGAGVVDRVRELKSNKETKVNCVGINVGEAAKHPEDFKNLRAELYWNLRDRFKDGDIDLSRLPQDIYDRLLGELVAIKYTYTSKGQIQIEPKKDMKKRLGRSPDLADALMLSFAPKRYGELPEQPQEDSKFSEYDAESGSRWTQY